jgi:hypothetical protein
MPGTGETVLHVAVEHGHTQVVELLLAAAVPVFADIDAADHQGRTALHLAAQEGCDSEILQQLIDAGASVFVSTSTGATPLYLAVASESSPAAIAQLLKAGASPTAAAVQGASALDLALHQGSEDIIIAMVKHTVSPQETSVLMGNISLALPQSALLIHSCRQTTLRLCKSGAVPIPIFLLSIISIPPISSLRLAATARPSPGQQQACVMHVVLHDFDAFGPGATAVVSCAFRCGYIRCVPLHQRVCVHLPRHAWHTCNATCVGAVEAASCSRRGMLCL